MQRPNGEDKVVWNGSGKYHFDFHNETFQNLQTTLNQLPPQRKAIQAKITSSRANLEGEGWTFKKPPFESLLAVASLK